MAKPPQPTPPEPPVPGTEAWFRAVVAGAPRYHTVGDLVELLGGGQAGTDRLVRGYVNGWLPREDAEAMEAHQDRLQCWLLARILRRLEGPTP